MNWKVKIKNIPGYHDVIDVIPPTDPNGANHYKTAKHGLVHQSDVEDIDFGIPKKLKKSKEVASIAVTYQDKLLMGQRSDNSRWTLPGGHLNPNESPLDGAVRELFEETGIKVAPHQLTKLGSEKVKTFTGKEMIIHSYSVNGLFETNSSQDPDQEVRKWEWVDCSHGVPSSILGRLHSPKNTTLRLLGLQKSFEKILKKSSENSTLDKKYNTDPNWNHNTDLWHGVDISKPKIPSSENTISKHMFVGSKDSSIPSIIIKPPLSHTDLKLQGPDEDGPDTSYFLHPEFNSSHREAAYSYLAHQYGFGKYVPKTSVFRHPHTNAAWSAMEFIPYAEPIGHIKPSDDYHKLTIFDSLLGNNDRHRKNVLVDQSNTPKLIDNANSFDYGHKFESHLPVYAQGFQSTKVPHGVHMWLQNLDTGAFAAHLKRIKAPAPIAKAALLRLAEAKRWSTTVRHDPATQGNLCDLLQVMQTHRLNDHDIMADARKTLYKNIQNGRSIPFGSGSGESKTR
jgi:ADP-ribose pyrophosphatase YjhB (NUDIX family)